MAKKPVRNPILIVSGGGAHRLYRIAVALALAMSPGLVNPALAGEASATMASASETSGTGKWHNIVIDGSSAVTPFVKAAVVPFAKDRKIGISVGQHGSLEGLQCVLKQTCQIGMVTADPSESKDQLVITQIGWDGIAIVTGLDVKGVDSLTSKQVHDIYVGKITNWKEVGGENLPINVYQREKVRGNRAVFDQHFGIQSNAPELGSNEAASNFMKTIKGGVTYIGLGFARTVSGKTVKLLHLDGIDSTDANIRSGKYALKRPMLLVRSKENGKDPVLEQLVQFLLNARQEYFEKLGLLEN